MSSEHCGRKMTTVKRISEHQLGQTIVSSLDRIVDDEGFMKHEKYVRAISTNGGNYMGDLYEVDIKEKSADGERELNLFIKCINKNADTPFIQTKVLQEREIMMYCELGRLYTQFMNEANIPENERLPLMKCYEANDEFLIFENMAIKGYETLDRTTPLSFDFAVLAIKQLAKFNALSFVLQSNDPEYFNTKLKPLSTLYNINHDFLKAIKDFLDILCDLLNENSEKRLRAAFARFTDHGMLFDTARCMCHGDFRSNNMLMKKEKGKIIDLIPIDYQMVYYGNPMSDFWYLMISHTDQEFRRQHLATLKELYYDTLTQFLKYFDLDVFNIYPRPEFEADYEAKRIFGLHASVVAIPFMFTKEDAVPELKDFASMKSILKLQDSAKERIQGIVEDYINWGEI